MTIYQPLEEHRAVDENPSLPAELEQTPEQKKLLKKVKNLFDKAKKAREKNAEDWVDYYRMFRGKQWFNRRPSYRHSEVLNRIFQVIQSLVPIHTDARPKISFVPTEPSDREFSEIMSDLIDSDWDKGNWSLTLLTAIYDSYWAGTAIGDIYFNREKDLGLGRMDFCTTDPFAAYPDPDAEDFDRSCDYFIKAYPEKVERLKRQYPKYAEYIRADIRDPLEGLKEQEHIEYISPTDTGYISKNDHPGSSNVDRVFYMEAYLRDDESYEEEEKVTGPEGVENTSYVTKLKYPNGRKVCIANGIILRDEVMEGDDGEFPFARLPNYIDPRKFWGISEIENLKSPQLILNKVWSFILDVLTLMGNPVWLNPSTSNVDEEMIVNRPGLIITYDDTPPQRVEGVQLQPYVMQIFEQVRSLMDELAGANDITRGIAPTGVTANAAIENLQNASQTRIRQKMRIMDDTFLKRIGRLYANRVLNYYTAPRVFRVTNKDGTDRYFKFHVEDGQDEYGKKAKVGKVRLIDQNNPNSYQEKTVFLRGQLDVKVNTESSLPFARADKEQKLLNLYDRQLIDDEEVLKNMDIPNWESILQRKRKREAEMAQMQAAQGGQK